MLPAFPPELVGQVLEALASRPLLSHAAYRVCQDALLSCCLVSHSFRALAQPFLRQAIYLPLAKGLPEVKLVVEADSAFRAAVRFVCVEYSVDRDDALRDFVTRLPRLEELRLGGGGCGFPLDKLATGATALHDLALHAFTLEPWDDFALSPFPALTSLTLDEVWILLSVFHRLLSSSITPSLRALRLGIVRNPDTNDEGASLPDNPPPDLERLDFLQLTSSCTLGYIAPRVFPCPVLYEADIDAWSRESAAGWLASAQPVHLHLSFPYLLLAVTHDQTSKAPSFLHALTASISSSPQLRTVSLPPSCHPSRIEDDDQCSIALGALLRALDAQGVAVSWRPQFPTEYDEDEDPRLDCDFWRYARRLREGGGSRRVE